MYISKRRKKERKKKNNMDEENKEYYIQEALKSITDLVRVNFNKIKTILDNADNYEKEEEDGFYFPKILVQALRDVDEQYHLNPYMDLSISDILNQIDDSDTIEDAVKEFFDDYAPEDAYSWAMNLIDTLSNEDLNVNSQYTVWKVYDVISENDLLNQNYNNSQFEGEEELKGFETEDEAMQYANDKYNELLKTEDRYDYNKGERAYSVLVLVVYDLDGDLINDISISWDDLYDEVVNGEKRKLEAEKEKLVNELTAEADKTYKEIKDIMIKEGSEEAFNNIKERVDRLDLRHIDKVDIKDIVDTIDYEDSAKEVVKELATNWDWDYNLDDVSEHRALDEVVKLFNNGDTVKEEGREIKKESKKDSTIEYVIAYNEGEDIFDTKEEADEKFEELEKAGKLKDVDEYYSKEWIWDDDINDYVEGNVEVFYYGDTTKEESISNNKEEHREILNEDTEEAEIINPDDEEYYNNLYRVTIGKGIGGVTFIVYANNEEEALEIAVAECEIKGYDGLISTIYEIKREVEESYEEEYKEYIEKNPEAALEDFIEDYLHYIYVDATEYEASEPYYVEGDYIFIEEEENIEGNKKEEALDVNDDFEFLNQTNKNKYIRGKIYARLDIDYSSEEELKQAIKKSNLKIQVESCKENPHGLEVVLYGTLEDIIEFTANEKMSVDDYIKSFDLEVKQQNSKKEEAKNNKYEIEYATSEYTGGNIYVYFGKLKDGNYFVASDVDFAEDDARFWVWIIDVDPAAYKNADIWDDINDLKWQDKHIKVHLDENVEQEFTIQLLNWLIKNNSGECDVNTMKNMLNVIKMDKKSDESKKEEAKRLPNISKFIYDIDNDKGNAWSVTDYTQDNNGNKLIVVSRNGNSKNSIDDIIEVVEKNYPQLEGQKMGRFDNKIWFYLKSDNKLDESKKEGAKATFKDKVRAIKKSLKDRDKRISDENAEEQAKKIAGSIVKKEKEKKQEDKSNIVTVDELKDKIYELGYEILDDDRDYTGHSIVVYKNNEVNNFEDNDNEALYTYLDSIPNIRYTIDDEDPSTLAIYLLDIEQEGESIDSKLYKEQELMNIVKDTMNKLPDAKQLQDFLSKCEENNILSLKVGDYFINWDYTVEDSTDPSWIGINVEGKGVPVAISCRKGTKSEQIMFGLKNGSLDYRSLYLGDEDKERYVLLYPIIEPNYSYICSTYDIDNIINCCKVLKDNIVTYMNSSISNKDESKEVIKLEGRKAIIIEDTNIGNIKDTNKTKFDAIQFEKQLPEDMRWKEYNIVEGNNLYWVTQAPFNEEDLKEFAKAFKETPFYKAYVTARDYSIYNFKKDKERNVFATVDKEGNINIADYLKVQDEDEKAYQEYLAKQKSKSLK